MAINNTQQVKKSTFSANKPASAAGGGVRSGSKSNDGTMERKTSHYAYTLETDAEGNLVKDDNGKVLKSFISSDVLQVYENEFSTKLRVLGPLPTGDIFIAKHKAK